MKVGIIGAGFVGSTTAYTLAVKDLVQQIVMIDINQTKAEAEALDILHAAAMNCGCDITFGDYADLAHADVVVITVDSQKSLNGDRLALLESNTKIMKEVVPGIVKYAPKSIILIATNPVDVITRVVLELSKFPANRVIGSGTVLDTARFREILAEQLGNISPKSIHAYVLGEHGNSSLVSWSTADVGGARIEDFEKSFNKKLSAKDKEKIAHDVIDAGFKIYRGKKATYYGIASSLVKIITAIAHNTKEILTVSTRHKDVEGIKDVCLSLPTIIDKDGAHNAFVPSLSDEEKSKLKESAEIMDKANKEALTFL